MLVNGQSCVAGTGPAEKFAGEFGDGPNANALDHPIIHPQHVAHPARRGRGADIQ